MTSLRVALVCVIAISLQLTVFVDVRILGVAPEMLALVAILAGYYGGPQRGPAVAFAAGLLWDVYLPTHLGVSSIIFAVAAYAIGSVEAGLFRDSRAQLAAVVVASTMAIVVSYALANEILGERGLIDTRMLKVAVVSGIFNGVLSFAAAPLVKWAMAAPRGASSGAAGFPMARG